MNILILMAGAAADFEEKGHSYPKYLLEIQNKPMIQRIIESLENVCDNITCIIRKQDQEKYYLADTLKILCPKCKVLELAGDTRGAVCTALFAIDEINNDQELLILNGDQLIKRDILEVIADFRARNLDGGLVTMNAVNPNYSTVLLDENNYVVQTSEKRPISPMASTGCSYYKKGSDFVKSSFAVIQKDVNTQGKYYISSTFNEMILNHKRVGIFEIPKKDYISFANFQMYESYISARRA
jgi:NDP-sugar pyrophosphorylase family protein